MRCFEKLVQSRFLQNVSRELSMARQTLQSKSHAQLTFFFEKDLRKRVYDDFVYYFYVREEITKSLEDWNHRDTIFFFEADQYLFAYTKSKSQIQDAIKYNYNQTGEMPFYIGKMYINGNTIYTLFVDKDFHFDPISPN
jgi:hypothetical protein